MEGTREEPRRTGAPQGFLSSFDPQSTLGIEDLASEQALRPLYEVNQHCIELLVSAAWSDRPTLPLVRQFQGSLRNLSAQARVRAAHKAFLLVDMEFMNGGWWELAKKQSSRITSPSRAPYFPGTRRYSWRVAPSWWCNTASTQTPRRLVFWACIRR